MSLNYQEIYAQITKIGQSLKQREKSLDERKQLARTLFEMYKGDISAIRSKVERLKQTDPNIRCALPAWEVLDTHLAAPPVPERATLIAADGSQITPDRHAPIQFGVVNVGAIAMRINSGMPPVVLTDSKLLFDEELLSDNGLLTDEIMALRRDLDERKKLLDMSILYGTTGEPVITFTDGPIELWGARDGEEAQVFYDSLKTYQSVLARLQSQGIITAGYVDKPSANLVIRTLELMVYEPEQGGDLRAHHPLRGVSDRWLFGAKDSPLLQAGERSGVFAIQSKSEKQYRGALALYFFYVNVGSEQAPYPVRVEIPRWVAEDAKKLDMLHAVLVAQCRQMGARPYPYLLHRAHETAVVSLDEKFQVEQMLEMEIRRYGVETDDKSYKQSAKDTPGRTSYRL